MTPEEESDRYRALEALIDKTHDKFARRIQRTRIFAVCAIVLGVAGIALNLYNHFNLVHP